MSSFFRSDLAQLVAYTPQPGHGDQASNQPDGARVIDRLDTNESPFDLPDDLKQKLAYQYQHEIEANRYPDGSHHRLKQAIAQYVADSAQLAPGTITSDQISVGNGSDELIRSILIATCLNGNGSILVAQPTFSMYRITAQTLGIPVVTVDRDPETFAIDCDAAQEVIAKSGSASSTTPPIRVIFVVHPNSPTANALTETEIQWLRTVPDNILVVIDEAYFEFSQTSLVEELSQHPNWVITRTFSKAFRLAAHRVGYSIAHPEVTAVFEKIRLPYNLPSFSQAAALVALNHYQVLLAGVADILVERDRLAHSLAQLPPLHLFPSQANFIYSRVSTPAISIDDVVKRLRTQGTLIRQTGSGLRITVGTADENNRTLQRLTQCLG